MRSLEASSVAAGRVIVLVVINSAVLDNARIEVFEPCLVFFRVDRRPYGFFCRFCVRADCAGLSSVSEIIPCAHCLGEQRTGAHFRHNLFRSSLIHSGLYKILLKCALKLIAVLFEPLFASAQRRLVCLLCHFVKRILAEHFDNDIIFLDLLVGQARYRFALDRLNRPTSGVREKYIHHFRIIGKMLYNAIFAAVFGENIIDVVCRSIHRFRELIAEFA